MKPRTQGQDLKVVEFKTNLRKYSINLQNEQLMLEIDFQRRQSEQKKPNGADSSTGSSFCCHFTLLFHEKVAFKASYVVVPTGKMEQFCQSGRMQPNLDVRLAWPTIIPWAPTRILLM